MQEQTFSVMPFNEVEVVDKLYSACRTCYAGGTPQEQYAKTQEELTGATGWEKKWKLIRHVLDSGHHSVLEHVSFTFFISGVSRALSHQLVRHRIGVSYSQQSQRYCAFEDGFNYVIPPSISKDPELLGKFRELMTQINDTYQYFLEKEIPAEDARMVLPNACTTNLTVTMNLRALMHFCEERMCTCAQGEIRQMARSMAKLITDKIPELKEYLREKCYRLGYCNENSKRSCGRKPLKSEVFKK